MFFEQAIEEIEEIKWELLRADELKTADKIIAELKFRMRAKRIADKAEHKGAKTDGINWSCE